MMNTRESIASEVERNSNLPVSVLVTIWSNLPILLFIDACLFVAALPSVAAFFAGGSFSLLAPLLATITLGPVWAGAVASTDRMVCDVATTVSQFTRNVKRNAWSGISIGIVPAIAATAALGTLAVLQITGEMWLYLPLYIDLTILVLCFLAGFSAFSLATTCGLSGWQLWRASLGIAAARPMATLGLLSLTVLLGFAVSFIPGILSISPAPIAVLLSSVTWATIGQEGEKDEECANSLIFGRQS